MALCARASAAPYAVEPLQTPVFDAARVLVEAVAVSNWLDTNYSHLSAAQTQGVREHIHALIDSRVKELYSTSKLLMPTKPDIVLAMLYAWVGRLGVYGADDVYGAVRGTYPARPPPGPRPPEGLAVALQGDALSLSSSAGGWNVVVPFDYFIFVLRNASEPDGKRTEAAAISMGSAPDVAPPGYSQATLAIIFTEGADAKTFEQTWTERFGVPLEVVPSAVGGPAFTSRKTYDEKTRLHKEVVFVSSGKGPMAILYSGLDGTYQWNRPHFLSFLANLVVAPCAHGIAGSGSMIAAPCTTQLGAPTPVPESGAHHFHRAAIQRRGTPVHSVAVGSAVDCRSCRRAPRATRESLANP